jgi:NADP-dependent alcohol dehydrogenase
MKNFTYYLPTKVIFGKGNIAKIDREIPHEAVVMVVYGTGSIKENGVYTQVMAALKNRRVVEFSGVMPNPDCDYLQKGIQMARSEGVTHLLAVGGGSVIDGTKFIAAGYYHRGDAWEMISAQLPVADALPIGVVLTLPATSSEMNHIGVISNYARNEKFSFRHPNLYPQFSVVDPEVSFSLSKKQLGYGIADAIMHVLEQYLNDSDGTNLQDYMGEAILRVLIDEGQKAMMLPEPDYDNRSKLIWAQSWALNGAIQAGLNVDLATHKVGHELTALFGIEHAPSLTMVYPYVLQLIKKYRPFKLMLLGKRIFNLTHSDEQLLMGETIKSIVRIFEKCNMPVSLKEYGVKSVEITDLFNVFLIRNITTLGGMNDIGVVELRDLILNDYS